MFLPFVSTDDAPLDRRTTWTTSRKYLPVSRISSSHKLDGERIYVDYTPVLENQALAGQETSFGQIVHGNLLDESHWEMYQSCCDEG